jgi:hypothetical protein
VEVESGIEGACIFVAGYVRHCARLLNPHRMTCVEIIAPVRLGVKTERIRTDSSETVFVTIFFSNSESERIVCRYEYRIRVYR